MIPGGGLRLVDVLAIRRRRASIPPRIPGEGPVRETAPRIVVSFAPGGLAQPSAACARCRKQGVLLTHRACGIGRLGQVIIVLTIACSAQSRNILVAGSIPSPKVARGRLACAGPGILRPPAPPSSEEFIREKPTGQASSTRSDLG